MTLHDAGGLPSPDPPARRRRPGHDQPTLLITNRPALPARQVIQTHARRMNIEQRLAEAICSFGLDALAGAVPLSVDLDVVLSVLLPGYGTATPDTLPRRLRR